MNRAGLARRRAAPRRAWLRERLASPAAGWLVAAFFLSAAFLLGGGARDDVSSLILLRPLAILAIGYALYRRAQDWRRNLGPPFWLLLALLACAAAQLVPLPHAAWSELPGRALIAANDAALGLGEIVRPISLSPSKTWNTVFALAVPLAVFLTAANLDDRAVGRLIWVVLAAGALNLVLAVLQMMGEPGGPFYFYRITNDANPVGLFANRNHLAIFLASLVPLVAHTVLAASAAGARRPLAITAGAAALLALLTVVLLTGSRAGMILLVAAVALSAALWLALAPRAARAGRRRHAVPLAAGILSLAAIAILVVTSGRTTTLDRFFSEGMAADLRVQVLPQLWAMVHAYFPVGAGFGSFEHAYRLFEPGSILRTTYLNQAHNDVLQFVIEGGLAALLLMIAFALWFGRAAIGAAGQLLAPARPRGLPGDLPFLWLALGLLAAGSVGDYPLRTPALMAFAALLCTLIHRRVRKAALA